jgi:hypothetical protein
MKKYASITKFQMLTSLVTPNTAEITCKSTGNTDLPLTVAGKPVRRRTGGNDGILRWRRGGTGVWMQKEVWEVRVRP